MFVIRRTDQKGGFVAPSGSATSFVRRPEDARHFRTAQDADMNRCAGNEVTVQCPHCAGNVPTR